MSSDLTHEYALGQFTVKESRGQFFITKTGLNRYRKPYRSLRHACTAIARRLEAEYVDRKARRLAFNTKFLVKRRAA